MKARPNLFLAPWVRAFGLPDTPGGFHVHRDLALSFIALFLKFLKHSGTERTRRCCRFANCGTLLARWEAAFVVPAGDAPQSPRSASRSSCVCAWSGF